MQFLILLLIVDFIFCRLRDAPEAQFPGEQCFRDCSGSKSRVCYFKFHLENYQVLGPACGKCGHPEYNTTEVHDCYNEQCITADGIERGVMSINRKIPGPAIHVCKDDLIVVDVVNMMGGSSTTIHWHGFHQRKSPFYDGVPYITQCPICFDSSFRYSFQASEPGTQFYHSHAGHHKANGLYGGIVVRSNPEEDSNSNHYDEDLRDHLVVVSDWMQQNAETLMPGLRHVNIQPTNILVNGRGRPQNQATGKVPLEVFNVERGQRYRFRFVNSMSHNCPAVIEIEDHKMLIIASDSHNLQPVAVDSLISTSGERYDFVINANRSGDQYWMRFKLIGKCEDQGIQQFAVLSYATEASVSQTAFPQREFPNLGILEEFVKDGVTLNHPNTTCNSHKRGKFCITDLSSLVERPDITDVHPDYQFFLGFQNVKLSVEELFVNNRYESFMNVRENFVVTGSINNISFNFPHFPLLTQPEEIRGGTFCQQGSLPSKCVEGKICSCVHRLKVQRNSIVEIIAVDATHAINSVNHPFHLHGHEMFVTGMGQDFDERPMTVERAIKMETRNSHRRSPLRKHPIKDTISVPSKGYAVLRFKADNPGFWLLHCHFEWHMAIGMGLVLQVGEHEEMMKPPENFPICNDFSPPIDVTSLE